MRSSWALSVADFGPLTIILVALVALIAALLIHNLSPRRTTPEPAVASADRMDLPDLRAAMLAAAARMELPERLLPAIARPSGGDGDFVHREGADYVYCSIERGTPLFEHRTADIDDLLYRVFRDRAWTRTYVTLVGQDLSPEDHAARLAEGQEALLVRADPRWAARLRAEQVLAGDTASLQDQA